MRRLTLLAMVVAALCLALSPLGPPEARAGWSGSPGPSGAGEPPTGWPSIDAACTTWAWYTDGFLYWTPFVGNEVACWGMHPVHPSAGIVPQCSGSDVADASQPSGCHPANAAPLPKELGCSKSNEPPSGRPSVGNPICLAGGNKFQAVTDFETATPDKLGLTRYYNSGGALGQRTMLGYGWQSMYDAFIDTTNSTG